ncbi:MAG: LamG domain-containing protein [Planctomycetota bacterium]|jgi:hypothetical protein
MKNKSENVAVAIKVLLFSVLMCVVFASTALAEGPADSVVQRLPAGLRESLILYYPFEKDDGAKAVDASGKARHGRVHGAEYVQDEDAGGAMSFDEDDDYVSVRDVNLDNFTFAAWVKPPEEDELSGQLVFLLKNGERGYTLRADWDTIRMIAGGDWLQDWHSLKNRWTHVAVTHRGRTFILYVNGDAVGEKDMGPNSVLGTLYLGGNPDRKDDCWLGLIDEVALFNRPLTHEEIKLLYDATDFQGRQPVLTVSSDVVQGRSCYLRPDKPKFKGDEIPTFKADVQDLPIAELELASVPSLGCQVELDGSWYRWSGLEWIHAGHDQCDRMAKYGRFLPLSLAEGLWLSITSGAPLKLTPGKHTVRLAWAGFWKTPRQERTVRLLSNPVQIEILGPEGPAEKSTPPDEHRRQVAYAFHTMVRPVSLTQADHERALGGATRPWPVFGWKDIPILLELAESKRKMESTPALMTSSYGGGPGYEGIVALWLVEGIRRKQLELVRLAQTGERPDGGEWREHYRFPWNAICRTEDGESTEPSLELHQRVLRVYHNWWRMVASLPPDEAAVFYPLDLTDIRWYGGGRHDEPLEIYDRITPEGNVAHRTIYGRDGQLVRTVYYTLKKLPALDHRPTKLSAKAGYRRAMMAVQKVVLYFYDDKGNIVRAKRIYPASEQP